MTDLPIEIINTIMEIAVTTLDPQSVSSITLLSQHFRTIANEKRYSQIGFDNESFWNDLPQLATLIEEAGGYQIRGIHTFITSLHIWIPDKCYAEALLPYVTIFNHLFKDDAMLCTPIRKLSISVTNFAAALCFAQVAVQELSHQPLGNVFRNKYTL
ncbi:hypothetical protein JR316_0012744 [Psilocybe cubensis]|uniref:Uncharacterized protein n=1 Tax=Psilocybe cubensis TaxID=181762 RepID=A0ACB8GJQ7_PSICU|nr:hypothetical protein JR316_0012744 [Psilocybe cubensis]KAH9475627.1 hypothetical protein JR316_0012744 [Psilocybe cubensis]